MYSIVMRVRKIDKNLSSQNVLLNSRDGLRESNNKYNQDKFNFRAQQWNHGEDARAVVSDQQMISDVWRYPVDRYLIKSNKKVEMVSIIDDDIWNSEPALKPEDEIILKKLHEMLQSTSDDLKQLSSELSKYHQSGFQIKATPTPLDEDFNEKVHIEEVVNAKFYGHKIIDKSSPANFSKRVNLQNEYLYKPKVMNTGVQANILPLSNKGSYNKNLGITRTRLMEINQDKNKENEMRNNKIKIDAPSVIYNEFSYKYHEPKIQTQHKQLNIQEMPSINIRSELKEQKVLQLDILPSTNDVKDETSCKSNIAVIAMHHEITVPKKPVQTFSHINQQEKFNIQVRHPARKVSKMLTCESSESSNNISHNQRRLTIQKKYSHKISPKTNRNGRQKSQEHMKTQLENWKKKLNVVYGQVSTTKKEISLKSQSNNKKLCKFTEEDNQLKAKQRKKVLNNSEYIPYSHLTLGGVRASDIENEIPDLPNKKNIPLSPILDKIATSREHSSKSKKHKKKQNFSPKILTTSDENLLQEVIDIENSVGETLSKNKNNNKEISPSESGTSNKSGNKIDSNNSYDDDFEDDKSAHSVDHDSHNFSKNVSPENQVSSTSEKNKSKHSSYSDENLEPTENQLRNTTYTKKLNLSFKNSVDVHEYVHLIDTQDSATQSNATHKISLKETQTSPKYEKPNIHPIRNDLWPSLDPGEKVENMFKLEKELIKKLILDEYGELYEKSLAKPSTSKDIIISESKNISASQKITQTSPARVKSVTTSPPQMKTRTTSPFTVSESVAQQTSPIENITSKLKVKSPDEEDDLGISINMSSPRFSLKLPQSSSEVLSNPEDRSRIPQKSERLPLNTKLNNHKILRKISSSSSEDPYNSSSDTSSLGEIILKRRLRNILCSESENRDLSIMSHLSSELNSISLKSEGEISLGQTARNNKNSKSEGEVSKAI